MNEPAEKLGALSGFMHALTPRGVALLLVLASTAGIGYAVWEQRATLLPAYLESTAALTGTGVAIALALAGLIVMDLYGRLEDRAERAMKTHADALQAQISAQAITNASTVAELVALRGDHAACQKQVAEMAIMVAKLITKLTMHELPIEP